MYKYVFVNGEWQFLCSGQSKLHATGNYLACCSDNTSLTQMRDEEREYHEGATMVC